MYHQVDSPAPPAGSRLGGPFNPTREALARIVACHAATRTPGLPALHNLPLWRVLASLGFDVTGLAARVVGSGAAGVPAPRTHLLLRVDLPDAPWVVDAELAGLVLLAPLRVDPETGTAAPVGPFRLALAGEEFEVQARVDTEWRALYRFGLEPLRLGDPEATHHHFAEAS